MILLPQKGMHAYTLVCLQAMCKFAVGTESRVASRPMVDTDTKTSQHRQRVIQQPSGQYLREVLGHVALVLGFK